MKSYTDLEQSKKLAEILPIKSADMHYATWTILDGEFIVSPNQGSTIEDLQEDYGNQIIPCWSLGALISILPKRYCLETLDNGTYACYNFLSQYEKFGKTPIDAVYSMIVFLKEEKII